MVVTDDEKPGVSPGGKLDHEAFQLLIQQHQQMIHSLCYRMTGSLEDAEDLSQETFIVAYERLQSFRGEAQFSSWLYRIAVNQCLNWKKSNQRRQHLTELAAEQIPGANNQENSRVARVREALMKLHPKQRAAVTLTTYDGLTHSEAAEALGCSETTISWRLFAARKKLKRWLKDLDLAPRNHD
jgi:RNA polymerase sigma-70 factor (ECF subfamily)